MGANSKSRRSRLNKLTDEKKMHCGHCPPNRGDNAKRRKKTDKYKSKRKGKC
jgi:hypothetical protein